MRPSPRRVAARYASQAYKVDVDAVARESGHVEDYMALLHLILFKGHGLVQVVDRGAGSAMIVPYTEPEFASVYVPYDALLPQ